MPCRNMMQDITYTRPATSKNLQELCHRAITMSIILHFFLCAVARWRSTYILPSSHGLPLDYLCIHDDSLLEPLCSYIGFSLPCRCTQLRFSFHAPASTIKLRRQGSIHRTLECALNESPLNDISHCVLHTTNGPYTWSAGCPCARLVSCSFWGKTRCFECRDAVSSFTPVLEHVYPVSKI